MKHRFFMTVFIGILALPAFAAVHSVAISGFAFSPSSIDIDLGDTVEWTNDDTFLHTVTEDNGLFDSGNMFQGDTFAFTFNDADSYGYFCGVHPSMTGTVNVGGSGCDLEVGLDGQPLSISRGETLQFTATAGNPCDEILRLNEANMTVVGPASVNKLLYSGNSVPIRPNTAVSAAVALGVPGITPLGTYTVTVTIYRGNHEEVASDSFLVTVTP